LEDFEKIFVDSVYVIAVNLTRSTINEAFAFRKIVEEEINSGHTNLVIDVSKCDYMDSTFFGVLIVILKMMKSKGYELKLVQPANPREDIFTAGNLTRLFDLYKTREDAVKSFV
jgi:anti-sigma B factor antagonist/stage II sporulation protein AA (anti-sigma F factor antagonist)